MVGTQESASVPKRTEEGLDVDPSLLSSFGPASPTSLMETAYSEPAASVRPFSSPERSGAAPEQARLQITQMSPLATHAHVQIDSGRSGRATSPGRSGSAAVPEVLPQPRHVPRGRGYYTAQQQQAASAAMPGMLHTAPLLGIQHQCCGCPVQHMCCPACSALWNSLQ